MKKTIKSALSLFVVAVMLLCMIPSAMAAIEPGIEIEAVATIGVGAEFKGTDLTAAMRDNWFLNKFDRNVLSDTGKTSEYLEKLVKFTKKGDGLEFTLAEKTTVKRLDLWIMSLGGIKEYRVLASEDGINNYVTVADKTFPLYNGTAVATDVDAVSSYYPIVFDAPVEAKSIKFVVDSFVNDNDSVAYISEAKVYSTNEINLGERNSLQQVQIGTKYYQGYSPYISNYSSWARLSNGGTMVTGTSSYRKASDGQMWPSYTSGWNQLFIAPLYIKNSANTDLGYFWWGTTFGNSMVKVNKIGLELADDKGLIKDGVIKEFEVWVSKDYDTFIGTTATDPTNTSYWTNETWERIATITCDDLTADDGVVLFELPNATEASAIFVKVTDYTGVPALQEVQMYSVANYELTSSLKNEKLEGTVAAGETLTFSIESKNNYCPNAKVYFALYSGDVLESVSVNPLALSAVDNKTYSATYTIPIDATGTLSVKAFYLDGVTLVPLINNPLTK